MTHSDVTDIEVHLHAETDKAWLVSTDGDREHAEWVPKSQAEIERNDKSRPRTYMLTAPDWLLEEKGLV